MFHKRKKNCNYKMYHGIILCIFGFICELACTKYGRTGKISHVVIPGNREIVGDKDFSVAKRINRKENYSEISSMQNEIFSSCIRTKGYENYKLLSIKVSCRDNNSSSEMLSGGREKNKALHAKYKFEKILGVLHKGRLLNHLPFITLYFIQDIFTVRDHYYHLCDSNTE